MKRISQNTCRYLIIFLTALTVIALETVSFQAIVYVNDYLAAMQVISIALLGIALGGLLSYFIDRRFGEKSLRILLLLFPVSILAGFFVITRLSHRPVLMMALLSLPYAIASIVISIMFNRLKSGIVYMFDLAGAGIGAVIVVFMIPGLREEGSFFTLAGLGTVPLFLSIGLEGRNAWRWVVLTGAVILLAVSACFMYSHLVHDSYNMVFNATADRKTYPRKIFHWMPKGKHRLLYSRGSLVERIDIIARKHKDEGKTISCYNGRVVDSMTNRVIGKRRGVLDNRFPTRLKLGQDPDTLLVGPSGQGLCKAVQSLGDGRIDAVEINEAIASLMKNELFRRSGRAYAGMHLHISDVRTFIARTKRKYDFITLLNTHRIWSIGHTGAPEYCHSAEAVDGYFDRLKKHGIVIFEERNINEQADLGIRRILITAVHAMKKRGIKRPERNIGVFELWHRCPKKKWDREKCRRSQRFTFMMFKKSPITKAEYKKLKKWENTLANRKRPSKKGFGGIKWRYLPQEKHDNYWAGLITGRDAFDVEGVDPDIHIQSVVTDDVPYPFDVYKSRTPQWEVFVNTAVLSLVMVLLPAVVAFIAQRRKALRQSEDRTSSGTNLLLVLYFAILGIGYLLIEIVFIQKFAIFLSSPVYTLVIVLATMLLSSGIGGYFSAGISRKKALASLAGVVLLSIVAVTLYAPVLDALMFLPFAARIVAAVVLIAPIGFFMGTPFPYAISLAKRELTEQHAGLLFGINGALGAMAAPFALILSLTNGFNFTLLMGSAAYAVCLGLLAGVKTSRPVLS